MSDPETVGGIQVPEEGRETILGQPGGNNGQSGETAVGGGPVIEPEVVRAVEDSGKAAGAADPTRMVRRVLRRRDWGKKKGLPNDFLQKKRRHTKLMPVGRPFKKGTSGNPGGKGSNEVRFTKELNRQLRTHRKMASFVRSIVERATRRSDKLAIEVINRLDGRLPESMLGEQKLVLLPSWMLPKEKGDAPAGNDQP